MRFWRLLLQQYLNTQDGSGRGDNNDAGEHQKRLHVHQRNLLHDEVHDAVLLGDAEHFDDVGHVKLTVEHDLVEELTHSIRRTDIKFAPCVSFCYESDDAHLFLEKVVVDVLNGL